VRSPLPNAGAPCKDEFLSGLPETSSYLRNRRGRASRRRGAIRLLGALLALAAIAGLIPAAASAVVPTEGQSYPFGTVVEGKCKSATGQATEAAEQWTVETIDPQRAHLAAGAALVEPLGPGLVPFGDFWLPNEATGEHAHKYQFSLDPHFSAEWNWNYVDQWAENLQGGSNTEELPTGANSSTCVSAHTYDTSGRHNPDAALGTFAGQFEGESVASGNGVALDRPGPYALDEWRLEFHYVRVGEKEFQAHPFIPKACGNGSLLFTETASTGELEAVEGAEANYRLAPPKSESGTNGKGEPETFIWVAQTYCLTATATGFWVDGAHGAGSYSGDMSQWPTSPYVNQYEAGAQLGLPASAHDPRPGAHADGAAALMMGMRQVLGGGTPAGGWPSLKEVYERTVNANGNFDPEQGLKLLKQLGFGQAHITPLPSDQASVADAGPPYPISYPNGTNEAAIDHALQSGPVVVETALGTGEWGKAGSGHMLLITGVDTQRPGNYVVDDPAGNYFSSSTSPSSPASHYGVGRYGYGVDYPKAWVLAYAANTFGRGMIEVGPYTGPVPVVDVADADFGGPGAPSSFYVEDSSGRRTGWIGGQAVAELPMSYAGEDVPWVQNPAGGDPGIEPSPAADPTGPAPRYLSVSEPATGLALHVVAGSGGTYKLAVEATQGEAVVAAEQLQGSAAAELDTLISSGALEALVGEPILPSTGGAGNSGGSPGNRQTTTDTGPPHPARPSAAQIKALLERELAPSGKAARIASLRRRGSFTLKFKALEAGTATVTWYEPAHTASPAKKAKARPILIASGKLRFTAAGTKSLSLRLTAAGKTLLRHTTHRLQLTAHGVFVPVGSSAVAVSRGFSLKP